ncbi:hypothetical protein A3H19_01890 [Candidatus Woesebacteria bacterium RIFCSPLOWO2_12_FULL_39_9]|nr:MAG: hypothetical protein A3H19_01890 [Candidatus Woesebacteria bacterium RIFCSPLOWO2_12_FULL_39_9]
MKKQTKSIILFSSPMLAAFFVGYGIGYELTGYYFSKNILDIEAIKNILINMNADLILNLILIFPFIFSVIVWVVVYHLIRSFKYLEL